MAARALTNVRGKAVDRKAIAAFEAGLAGRLIRPGGSDYAAARRIWNASIDRRPGLIVRCQGAADVVEAVNFARENNLRVAVRGGGHNVGGRAISDGGIVIDLSGMKAVHVDAARRSVRVQGGATLGDLDRETHLYGLAVPAGVVSQTGIAGLALGGGVGWLVRKHGLTCDNVLAFEVVTADGRARTASARQHPDLFWALRGGGGNFGVVTSFEFRAYPVSTVLGGLLVHPRERAGELLRFYRGFIEKAPRELTAYCGLLHTPDGMPAAAVIACWSGERSRGEKVLRPLRQFGPPLLDAIQPMPFPALQSMLDDAFPSGNQNYWKSTFLDGLSDGAIDLLVAHANKAASPLSAVVVEYYAGAANKVAPTATAFAHRQMSYDIGILAQWTKPRDSKRHVAWARGLSEALKPHASGAFYLNFLDQEADATIRAAFGRNYARLARIKKKYDPQNFFRLNQNIAPAK